MTFSQFYQSKISDPNFSSDKGTTHDYINGYYSNVFTPSREKEINLLEIGMYKGQSIRLFREWFTNGNIYGIDIGEYVDANTFKIDGTSLFWGDAFNNDMLGLFKDNFFDFIIDDGPHTLESQLYSIIYWSKKLKSGGKLIIEDVQNINHIVYLEKITDSNLFNSNVFDLRPNKNRYDDIIFEVTKK
jgi:hypothetical protein